ncbi:pilus assembly protein PilQ [Sulfurimicrobium lacus]|uniref:Type IV pilus biogenesis and competence protein PilQ n=2 Tax=Sulfurimicrobium lacus TaxID=2715678 RepID=A0A6F8VH68_9PROT|nr:pilus assembly protein PilQ [Sulfurimicrobium lacus]
MFRMACAVLLTGAATISVAADGGASAPVTDQNNIESVTYTTLPNGKIEVKVSLKQALATPPVGFTTNNPPRIALDFPGTANSLGKNLMEVGQGTLRTVNIVQAGTRTRLVMNLAKPVGYETRMDGKDLYVTLQNSPTVVSNANVTTRFAEAGVSTPVGQQIHSLNDIDFRRGSNGEGRIVVGLSDSTTGIDIRKVGKNLVVEFIDAKLPTNLERRLDVLDFGTPVKALATSSQGKNTRMVIEPQGLWEYSAYQADRQFIVDVKKVVEDPNKMVASGKQGYAGEKLSLNFQNVEVRTVLQVIADFTNLNIITSDSVSGSLTLRLKDVPWDQALDIILNAKGLDKRKNGNVIWIAPRDELAVKEKAELEARQQVSELEPLQTEYYSLNYLRADTANKMLLGQAGTTSDKGDDASCAPAAAGVKATASTATGSAAAGPQKILSKRGTVTFDQKTNMLIVNDIPSKHEEIRRLLAVIDVPAKQVMIEARIVSATDGFSKELGVRLGTSFKGSIGNKSYSSLPQPLGLNVNNVDLPVGLSPISGASPATLALTLMNLSGGNLINLELSAMESDNKGTVLSNPRVMTSNQRPAAIVKGIQFPVITPGTANSPPTTTYKDALLCLLVNPQVLNNDSILLDVEITKDDPQTPDTAGNRALDINRVKTQILVNNGDTAVLGGIFIQDTKKGVDKVPLLGDIPVFGNLFKKTTRSDEKNELMIFITPRILKESLNVQ